MKTIGFIGLGAMGHPVAANVVRAGFTAHDIVPESVAAAVARGAQQGVPLAVGAAARELYSAAGRVARGGWTTRGS